MTNSTVRQAVYETVDGAVLQAVLLTVTGARYQAVGRAVYHVVANEAIDPVYGAIFNTRYEETPHVWLGPYLAGMVQ